jgi:predicted house-cleaning noncanonical NTP pyrophosphatase (MazG superfamily)
MTIYNKLVRDKIPELIAQSGEKPLVRILDSQEYIACLEAKLDEEAGEYHRDKNAEELADIIEVVFALAAVHGVSEEELLTQRLRKRESRGGFFNRVFLIGKE